MRRREPRLTNERTTPRNPAAELVSLPGGYRADSYNQKPRPRFTKNEMRTDGSVLAAV